MTALAFKSADEIFAHYAGVKARLATARPRKPALLPIPEVTVEIHEEPPVQQEQFPVVIIPQEREYRVTAEREINFMPDENGIIPRLPKKREILNAVSLHYNIPIVEILSNRRTYEVTLVRHVVAYLLKRDTLSSYPEIGRFLGGRDHTTIMHACDRIKRMIDEGRSPL